MTLLTFLVTLAVTLVFLFVFPPLGLLLLVALALWLLLAIIKGGLRMLFR